MHYVTTNSHYFLKKNNNSCPEIESGGFWQLADYSTLMFKITAF